MPVQLRGEVLSSVQRALLGAVDPELRAVGVDIDDADVEIRCYYHGEVSAEHRERMSALRRSA